MSFQRSKDSSRVIIEVFFALNLLLIFIMQDNNIPRNLTDSLFKDFQLPEYSHINPKNPSNKPPTLTQSKYKEDADDDFFMMQLQEKSKVVQKMPSNVPSTSSTKTKSTEQESPPAPVSKMIQQSKMVRKRGAKKAEPEPKKEVDIDNQIGQIAEWAEKAAKNNSDQQDFNQTDKVGETAEQIQARKRIEEKLKTGFNNNNKTGGLQAKLSQLKKQNEAKLIAQEKPISAQQLKEAQKDKLNRKMITEEHQTSTEGLMQKETKKARIIQEKQSEDDPWQKVNQNTINQYNHAKQKRKNMSFETVLSYYQKQFTFNEADIEIIEEQQKVQKKKEEPGCLELIFSCFKEQPKAKPKSAAFNIKIAKLLIAISKKQLSNSQEEFFVLKEIWTRLTSQPFSRYGSHWNKIGFQGRDPATDLRSTGVLSILQWLIFIQNHQKLAKQQAQWSIQNQFPLALTHIKITGVFLDLLEQSSLRGQSWEDFQRSYNALVIGIFKKLKDKFKAGEILGTLVEQQVRNSKKSFQKDLQAYDKQYKK